VLGLPPLDFFFGSALGSEQLHLHESASDSVVSASRTPACKNIWGEIGDCHVTAPSRRQRRVVPHTHF